jgi:hypothetical protein
MVHGTFWKISKNIATFEKESYEIAKIFGGFGQNFSFYFFLFFLKSSYFANRFLRFTNM